MNFLKSRSLVYYQLKNKGSTNKIFEKEVKLENMLIKIFRESRNDYGTRKIPQIMEEYSLVSSYTVGQYKVHRKGSNQDNIPNTVNRGFKDREIIGFSAGPKKDIKILHTDRANEFKNKTIDEVIKTFEIERPLSSKACPYDNAGEKAYLI